MMASITDRSIHQQFQNMQLDKPNDVDGPNLIDVNVPNTDRPNNIDVAATPSADRGHNDIDAPTSADGTNGRNTTDVHKQPRRRQQPGPYDGKKGIIPPPDGQR